MVKMVKMAKCKICGNIFKQPGIWKHMKARHGTTGIQNKNWEYTTSKSSSEKKEPKLKCLLCQKITKSNSNMLYHLKTEHGEKMLKGTNWECVGHASKGSPKKKKSPKVTAPNMQYIEVPAIIRIPITMGPIQLVSIEGA